jgi:SUMO ligase MMS21 Smc5/6 complex component
VPLINAIDELLMSSMKPSKQRQRRFKEVVAFVAATLFMLKSEVCPNVDLPDWDSVNAEPEPELH